MNASTETNDRFVVGYLGKRYDLLAADWVPDYVIVDQAHHSGFATIIQHADSDASAQGIADDLNRNALDMDEVAALPHHQQRRYFRVQEMYPDWSHKNLLAMAKNTEKTEIATLFTDKEIRNILAQAAEIDEVTGRVLGTGELMILDQRDMIRRGVAR